MLILTIVKKRFYQQLILINGWYLYQWVSLYQVKRISIFKPNLDYLIISLLTITKIPPDNKIKIIKINTNNNNKSIIIINYYRNNNNNNKYSNE
jgi:hypothetical protein